MHIRSMPRRQTQTSAETGLHVYSLGARAGATPGADGRRAMTSLSSNEATATLSHSTSPENARFDIKNAERKLSPWLKDSWF
jgi:hypothetical protein